MTPPRELRAYASRTGTRRNLAALRSRGWRILVSAAGDLRSEGLPYALDNGAWSDFQDHQSAFDGNRYARAVEKLGQGADWIALPDIVAGGLASLDLSLSWLPRLEALGVPLLIPVQDGMTPELLSPLIGPQVGIFLGGTTDWKLSTAIGWGQLAHRCGAYFHFARANSRQRINICLAAGAHSFDGSSASRYSETISLLDHARRHTDCFAPHLFDPLSTTSHPSSV